MEELIQHTFGPVCGKGARVLILGSMPSVKSLEQGFYYANPQNRFWRVLAAVTGAPVPESVPGRRDFLVAHGVALWDVLYSCTRSGSLDSAIRDPQPNDIPGLLQGTEIRAVFTNGGAAAKYLKKFYPEIAFTPLPSTSPANAAHFDLTKWLAIREYLSGTSGIKE